MDWEIWRPPEPRWNSLIILCLSISAGAFRRGVSTCYLAILHLDPQYTVHLHRHAPRPVANAAACSRPGRARPIVRSDLAKLGDSRGHVVTLVPDALPQFLRARIPPLQRAACREAWPLGIAWAQGIMLLNIDVHGRVLPNPERRIVHAEVKLV